MISSVSTSTIPSAGIQVITLAPGEARMLQLADQSWVIVAGIALSAEVESNDVSSSPPPSSATDITSVGNASSIATPAEILKPPSIPTWGTVLVTEPNSSPTGITTDVAGIDWDPDLLSALGLSGSELVGLRFKPNPGMVEAPGIYLTSPLLAEAIGSYASIEFVAPPTTNAS